MNVMITDMSEDLDTTVQGIQIAITIFLLVMAALMIPGGKHLPQNVSLSGLPSGPSSLPDSFSRSQALVSCC